MDIPEKRLVQLMRVGPGCIPAGSVSKAISAARRTLKAEEADRLETGLIRNLVLRRPIDKRERRALARLLFSMASKIPGAIQALDHCGAFAPCPTQ
jgi:hypothetical protein